MKLRQVLLVIGLCALVATPARPSTPIAKSWAFVVSLADVAHPVFDIAMTLRGFSGDVDLCLFMPNIDDNVSALRRISPGPAIVYDDECWHLRGADPQGTSLSYKLDLGRIADRKGSADYVERIGDTFIWNDQAVLLHPSPYPRPDDPKARPSIDVEFHLPTGVLLVAPWTRTDGNSATPRFRFDSDQHDGGSYVTMGSGLQDLGAITTGKTVTRLHMLNLPHRATADALRAWLGDAMRSVSGFYGDSISKEVVITLIPVEGSSDPGVFGTVVRRGVPSVLIYFGADCATPKMSDDWVAVHELFHIGNPIVDDRVPWFSEGFTTYYQDILRARVHALTVEAAWGDLHDSFRRFCQPQLFISLAEESQQLHRTHRYTRVYWGGACLAFLADATIRARTSGKRSLDDVMLRLRKKSLEAPVDEAAILAILDEEAGDRLISKALRERRSLPISDWFRRLGIEPTGPTSVRFSDSAPLAGLRKAMTQ